MTGGPPFINRASAEAAAGLRRRWPCSGDQ